MAGFTLIYQHEGLSESVRNRAERLVNASFKIDLISKSENLFLLFRDGNHYPYEIIENNDFIAIIEGKIYDLDAYGKKTFQSKLKKIFSLHNVEDDLKYFHDLDGEFMIYLIDKKGEKHIVINDYLGRLPAYFYNHRQFILSRDIYMLDKLTTGLMFDEPAIYQYLRLGFPLGEKTLFQGINRFSPASVLVLEKDHQKIESYPFDASEYEGTLKDSKPELALYEVFRQGLERRIKKENKVVMSLSGGLDSRLILGEIVKQDYPVDLATFSYENEIIKHDVEVVKQFEKHYNKSSQIIKLKEWAPELFDEMVLVKGGMNYVGMSFILDFLKKLGASYSLMFSGDGGDKTLPALFPLVKPQQNKLSGLILKSNSCASAKEIDYLVSFDVQDYEKEFRHYLKNLPGKDAQLKYKHYQLFERALHWLFEGEDRNRNYIWSTTPFYNPLFFKLAHSIPEKEKTNFRLFRKFIELVDPELNKMKNPNWGISPGDVKKVDRMFWRQKVKNKIPFKLKRYEQQSNMHEELVWYVSELLHKGFGGQVLINADKYDLKALNTDTLFHLLTILKVSELTWKGI